MSNYYIFPAKSSTRAFLAIIQCMFFFTNSILAQAQNNTSYNLNNIPISGTYNTAFGWLALFKNTTGSFNTAAGYAALSNNTSGTANTAN